MSEYKQEKNYNEHASLLISSKSPGLLLQFITTYLLPLSFNLAPCTSTHFSFLKFTSKINKSTRESPADEIVKMQCVYSIGCKGVYCQSYCALNFYQNDYVL